MENGLADMGERERRGAERVALTYIHQRVSNRRLVGSCSPLYRGSAWCSVTASRGGVGQGREAQEGGDRCIRIADSHHCTAETNTRL